MTLYSPARFIFAFALLAACWLAGTMQAIADESNANIESVLKSYLRAAYARNSDESYALLSELDKAEKSLEVYRTENGSYSDPELLLSEALADAIQFKEISVSRHGKKATVTFSASLPDANDPKLRPIVAGFDKTRLGRLDKKTINNRLLSLNQMAANGELPMLDSFDEHWDLVEESGQWRVFVNWAEAVEVNFDAMVMHDLGWEFEPVQTTVMAQPGQTIEMAYRVKNTGMIKSTGKARHIIGPGESMHHLDIVACFCFFEQTLAPNEELEMPLVFRVSYDAPVDLTQFSVKYEFYPLDSFPDDQLL